MIVTSNAGPLIALARIGYLDLLQSLYGQVYIPPAVQHEVVAMGQGRPGASEIAEMEWIRVVAVGDKTAVDLLKSRLDAGESEAIVLAIQLQADVLLIDETLGRRVAESQGLHKTGTIGTLILAKQSHLISQVTPLLDQLQSQGFRMGKELYHTAQSLAGEAN